jgi:hypothetical protein
VFLLVSLVCAVRVSRPVVRGKPLPLTGEETAEDLLGRTAGLLGQLALREGVRLDVFFDVQEAAVAATVTAPDHWSP